MRINQHMHTEPQVILQIVTQHYLYDAGLLNAAMMKVVILNVGGIAVGMFTMWCSPLDCARNKKNIPEHHLVPDRGARKWCYFFTQKMTFWEVPDASVPVRLKAVVWSSSCISYSRWFLKEGRILECTVTVVSRLHTCVHLIVKKCFLTSVFVAGIASL